jgi:hypothetical protein
MGRAGGAQIIVPFENLVVAKAAKGASRQSPYPSKGPPGPGSCAYLAGH